MRCFRRAPRRGGQAVIVAALVAGALGSLPAAAQAQEAMPLCGAAHGPDALDALSRRIASVDHGAWYLRRINGYALLGPDRIVTRSEPQDDGGYVMRRTGPARLVGRPVAGAESAPDYPYWRPILGPEGMAASFRLGGAEQPLPELRSVVTDDGERIDPPFTQSTLRALAGCPLSELPRLTGHAQFRGGVTEIALIMIEPDRMLGEIRESAPRHDVTFVEHVTLTPVSDPPLRDDDDALELVEVSPPPDRANVDFESPAIRFRFSEPVAADSVAEALEVTTRLRSDLSDINTPAAPDLLDGFLGGSRDIYDPARSEGDWLVVAGEVAGSGHSYSFTPAAALDPGVRYRVVLRGGEDGVQGLDGSQLPADESWEFHTVVDLDAQAAEDGAFSLDVYQTSRNAPLVEGKPALTRLGVHWDLHDHISPAWQVPDFPAEISLGPDHVRVEDQFGRDHDVGETTLLAVRHRDEVATPQHLRDARDTLNFYGWVPEGSGAATLELTLAAHDVYPAPRAALSWEFERTAPIWDGTPPDPFRLYWVVLNVGEWSEGISPADMVRVQAMMEDAAQFSTQVMPVVDSVQAWLGAFTETDTVKTYLSGDDDAVEAALHALSDATNSSILRSAESIINRMLLRLGRYYAGQIGPHDVLVAIHPLNYLDTGAAMSGVHVRPDPETGFDRRVVRMPIDANMTSAAAIARDMIAHGVVHEVGHAFGLHHQPGHLSQISAVDEIGPLGHHDGIDGFRLRRDGLAGWNKSSEHGNQQHERLFPLMFPAVRPLDEVFIRQDHYEQLLDAFAPGGAGVQQGAVTPAGNGIGRARWPMLVSAAHAQMPEPGFPSFMIHGVLRPGDGGAVIEGTHQMPDPAPRGQGDHVAELRTASGQVLSQYRFAPEPALVSAPEEIARLAEAGIDADTPFWWSQFAVAIDFEEGGDHVILRRGDSVLARIDAPKPLFFPQRGP